MNIRSMRMVALVMAAGLTGTAQAALQGRDLNGSIDSFEAYYDTDLNITWLADANYANTSNNGLAAGDLGRLTWIESHIWARDLRLTDGVNNITYDNWRLPSAMNQDGTWPCTGFNCTGSEMGHLFYVELGGVAGQSIHTNHNANYSLFSNIQPGFMYYWLDVGGDIYGGAGAFDMRSGQQIGSYIQDNLFYAWAVSDGDVGIAAVPEADTWAMLLAGLGLVGTAMRRQRRQGDQAR